MTTLYPWLETCQFFFLLFQFIVPTLDTPGRSCWQYAGFLETQYSMRNSSEFWNGEWTQLPSLMSETTESMWKPANFDNKHLSSHPDIYSWKSLIMKAKHIAKLQSPLNGSALPLLDFMINAPQRCIVLVHYLLTKVFGLEFYLWKSGRPQTKFYSIKIKACLPYHSIGVGGLRGKCCGCRTALKECQLWLLPIVL